MSEALYKAAGAGAAGAAPGADAGASATGGSSPDDDAIDAEFEVKS
jgi:hypothetical protein